MKFRKRLTFATLTAILCSTAPALESVDGRFAPFISSFDASAKAARPQSGMWNKREIQRLIVTEASRNGIVPPALALAVARVESDFAPWVQSYAGARGVMQIMPATAWGEFRVAPDQLWAPETNVRLGIAFLGQLYRMYGDRWDLALSHYNGGVLGRSGGQYVAHSYTERYVRSVMRWWRVYQREGLVMTLMKDGVGKAARFRTRSAFLNSPKLGGYDAPDAACARALPDGDGWVLEEAGVNRSWRDYLAVANCRLTRRTNSPAAHGGSADAFGGFPNARSDGAFVTVTGSSKHRFKTGPLAIDSIGRRRFR